MADLIPFAQYLEEQCPKSLDCMLVKGHADDCYIPMQLQKKPGYFGSQPTDETRAWVAMWRERRQQQVLDRLTFDCVNGPLVRIVDGWKAALPEVTIVTMLQGYPSKVKRIVFSDADHWHVTRIQVGLCDQLKESGVNAAVLGENCQTMIEKVTGGHTLRLTIQAAENSLLTHGEIVFYGDRLT